MQIYTSNDIHFTLIFLPVLFLGTVYIRGEKGKQYQDACMEMYLSEAGFSIEITPWIKGLNGVFIVCYDNLKEFKIYDSGMVEIEFTKAVNVLNGIRRIVNKKKKIRFFMTVTDSNELMELLKREWKIEGDNNS